MTKKESTAITIPLFPFSFGHPGSLIFAFRLEYRPILNIQAQFFEYSIKIKTFLRTTILKLPISIISQLPHSLMWDDNLTTLFQIILIPNQVYTYTKITPYMDYLHNYSQFAPPSSSST